MTETRLSLQTASGATPTGSAPLHLTVISGSVRQDRVGPAVADWVTTRLHRTGVDVTTIDLATVTLPDDRHLVPGGGPRSEMAADVAAADGFVLVTPEHNHSCPASLKRAIDWHYTEWMFKAATVVSYGAQGGLLAGEHLRAVLAELHVVTTRRTVGLRAPWTDVGPDGLTVPEGTDAAFDAAAAELTWWAQTLREARTRRPFAP